MRVVEYGPWALHEPGTNIRRLWRALILAPRLEVCEALLRGETVPISQLDPVWVKRLQR